MSMSLAAKASAFVARLTERFDESRLGRFVQRCGRDEVGLLSAAVAFTAILSMFPILLAVLSIVGFVLRSPDLRAQAQAAVLAAVPSSVAEPIIEVLEGTTQLAGVLGLISLATLLWFGSGLFGVLEAAFDRIYRVQPRPFVRQRLMGFRMILLFALLVIVTIVAPSLLAFAVELASTLPGLDGLIEPATAALLAVVERLIAILGAFFVFFEVYRVVPNRSSSAREVLPGAAFAAAAFVLLSTLFPLYISLTGAFSEYGAVFGLFFLLMIWGNLFALSVLIGAEINAQAAERDLI